MNLGNSGYRISNGFDAPSTILEHCSSEFKEVFDRADVIISKGQGNLEGLLGKTGKDVFFLLMVKCEVIANSLAVPVNSFVAYNPQLFHPELKI